jgi:hypothetical protein
MKNKFLVTVITGDSLTSRFMQGADVFEHFKVFANIYELGIVLKPDVSKSKALGEIRTLLERNGQRVVAIFMPNEPDGAWRDKSVKVVSDGYKWFMLEKYLEEAGFIEEQADAIRA